MFRWLASKVPMGRLVVVPFSGAIIKKHVDDYLRLLRTLEAAKNVKGVMLEIDSPGGSATASEMLFDRLKRLNGIKPLYCYALMAASGGYMSAIAARKIFAPTTAVIGSIGVLSVKPVLGQLMERIGVKLEVMKKGEMKDMTLFHRESTEKEKESWEALHSAIYERFIEMVSLERGIDAGKIRQLATGELFSAARAKELGLIDEVADFDTALDALSEETGVKRRRTITLKPRRPLIRRITSETAASLSDELYNRLFY